MYVGCALAFMGQLDITDPRPSDVPALLWNYRMHQGHGCRTEATLLRICRERRYLPET